MNGCLIIHGYTGGPHEVEPLATFLRERTDWKIQVPTLPGHGENLALDDVTHENWLEAAEQSLKRLKRRYRNVYVIGFSMGGMIAAYLAAKYNVDKLVLLAPARKYISLRKMTHEIGEIISDHFRGVLEENEFYVNLKNKRGDVPFKANLEFFKLVNYTKSYLKEVQSPVLIAQGQQDSVVPAKVAHYLDKEIESEEKQIVLFERSSHLLCLGDDKDILNEIVYSFLTENE